MGNDLLLNTVHIKRGTTPDWDGARKYIENLTIAELQEHPEFEYVQWAHGEDDNAAIEELRGRLLRCHDAIRAAFNGEDDRHTYIMKIGIYDVLVTGGDSWGDSPSDMFDMIQDWGNVEGLEKFGFYPDWEK